MKTHLVFDTVLRMRGVALAILLGFAGGASAAPAATVIFANGDVRVLSAGGDSRTVQNGSSIESGESLQTGKGRVQLRMVDGAMMSLNENTLLRLDDYHLAAPGGEDERAFMSLVKGALRTISGTIGKPKVDNYRLDTPTGTIGIRGTEYTASVEDGLRVGVVAGRVAVCNDGGCVDVPKGSGAFTRSRMVKPVVATRVSMILPPANPVADSSATSTAAADTSSVPAGPVTPATDFHTSTSVPTAGDAVVNYLTEVTRVAAAGPSDPATASGSSVDQLAILPGTSSTAVSSSGQGSAPVLQVVTTAPTSDSSGSTTSNSGTSGSSGGASTGSNSGSTSGSTSGSSSGSSGASSTTPTTPSATIPLASGAASLGLVWSTDKGELGSGLTQGITTFDSNGALTALDNSTKNKKILDKGVVAESGADGIIAWGRWTGGQSKVNDASGSGKGNLATLNYFAFAQSPSQPAIGLFSSFASTAPTVQSGGSLVATGSVNGASGSITSALLSLPLGTATYLLSVPVAGQTFTLAGVARQTSTYGFSGVSLITSTGSGCTSACTGSLGNNVSVIGLIGGASGNRAGATYGFNSSLGNVSGVIVFKH